MIRDAARGHCVSSWFNSRPSHALAKAQCPLDSAGGNSQRLCGFFDRQPGEVPEFNKFGQFRLVHGELRERRIEIESTRQCRREQMTASVVLVELLLIHIAAAFETLAASSVFNQNSAHCLCRRGEEMRTTIPVHRFVCHQSDVRFMDKRGRVERLARLFLAHPVACQPTQLRIDERQQVARCGDVALLNLTVGSA